MVQDLAGGYPEEPPGRAQRVEVDEDLRCSSWTRANRVDPIGSAGSYQGILLVEWPLPWPQDVSAIADLAPVAEAARAVNTRLQAVAVEDSVASRVALYRWEPSRGRYLGVEVAECDDLPAAALGLLAGRHVRGSSPIVEREVLVCGHGTRDRCCGSMGTRLERSLQSGALGDGTRVSRTSHTGGHRFAPTAIVLPEGTWWGYLDGDALSEIVTRKVPFSVHSASYRGCSGLDGREKQALERAVLAEVGWSLFDQPRTGEVLGSHEFRLTAGARSWQARVVTTRMLPVPKCGFPVTGTEKQEPELEVQDLQELAPQN